MKMNKEITVTVNKWQYTYLMSAGTLLPAFAGITVHEMVHKRGKYRSSDILIFAALTIAGGIFTSRLLKKKQVSESSETQNEDSEENSE